MEHMDWIVSITAHKNARMACVVSLMVLAMKVSEIILTKICLVYIQLYINWHLNVFLSFSRILIVFNRDNVFFKILFNQTSGRVVTTQSNFFHLKSNLILVYHYLVNMVSNSIFRTF